MLFEPEPKFRGLPREGFALFSLPDREQRRREIVATIHPALAALGDDLVARLSPLAERPLHAHLPRLDWPRDYQPFCTWLALSRETHGYQSGPQLNLGVHATHVAIRLGWDVAAAGFGRFEFLCRHADLGAELLALAAGSGLAFRVYASARWPAGSREVFCSTDDLAGSFAEIARHGVWWELGRTHPLPAALDLVSSPALGEEAAAVFTALLAVYDRIAGHDPADGAPDEPGATGHP